MLFNLLDLFKRLDYTKPEIPTDAVKTEEVYEKDNYRVTTTTWKAPGFVYTTTTTEPIAKSSDVLTELKNSLKQAVSEEDYLKAAELKKEIDSIEKG